MAEIIEMPKLSDTMTSGTLIKWLVKEGDSVSASDMIAEVETDKATMEVENFEDGVVLKIYVQEGDSVEIGSPICAIGEEGEEAPDVEPKLAESDDDSESDDDTEEDGDTGEDEPEPQEEAEAEEEPEKDSDSSEDDESEEKSAKKAGKKDPDKSKSTGKPSAAKPEKDTSAPPAPPSPNDGHVKASPLARKIAAELGVPLGRVTGTGPGGRIIRADVEEAAKAGITGGVAESASSISLGQLEEKTEKVTNMRAAIAKALVKSKNESPHFYLQSEVDAEPLATIRQDLNSFLTELAEDQGGIKFTVNDLILKAAAMAALKVPAINRSWQGDSIKQFGSVNLAFGVAVDEGLVTPVIPEAETKSLRQISIEAKELIKKARNRKLKPDEMSGSTLTVTNLGMFGISDFYGIINPGNAAILSVGATVKKPVVNEHDQIVVGYRMKVGLSGDHRVIDGAVGAQYLDALRGILEKPSILLV